MNLNEILKKVVNWEELTQEEKIVISKIAIVKDEVSSNCEKIISWREISFEEKKEIAKELVAPNVVDILQKEILVASLSWEKTRITLKASDCRDSDKNIRKFLIILWAKNVKVTSDFPCWRAWESYEWTTTIEFNY